MLAACGDHDQQSSGTWPQRPSCQQPVPSGGHRKRSAPLLPDRRRRDLRSSDARPQRSIREFHWFTAAAWQLGQPVITVAPWPIGCSQCLPHAATTTSSPAGLGRTGQVGNSQCRPAGGGERSTPAVPDHGHCDLRSSGSRPERSSREIQWFTAAACQLGQPVITEAPCTKT